MNTALSSPTPLNAEQWIAFHCSPFMQGVICIILPMLLACVGLILTRRFVHQHFLRQHHDMAGPFFNTMGSIYGIFLALIVSNTWHYFDQTSSNVVQEARYLESLHNNTAAFAEPFKGQIRSLLAEYRDSLVKDEWPLLAAGASSPRSTAALKKLTETYASHQISGIAVEGLFLLNQYITSRNSRDSVHPASMTRKPDSFPSSGSSSSRERPLPSDSLTSSGRRTLPPMPS